MTSGTTVQLSQSSGSGTLSGTLSGTISNGSGSVAISATSNSVFAIIRLNSSTGRRTGIGMTLAPSMYRPVAASTRVTCATFESAAATRRPDAGSASGAGGSVFRTAAATQWLTLLEALEQRREVDVLRNAEEKAQIAILDLIRAPHLVCECCNRHGRRNRIWHFAHRHHSARNRSGCLRLHRSFCFQARLAEMHMAIDQPGHQ